MRTPIVTMMLVLALVAPAAADTTDKPTNVVTWVNAIIVQQVQMEASTRLNANQAEAPSRSDNSTSLVDLSSASDLIGIALNLAGLTSHSGDSNDDGTSVSGTVSAYALYSAARGRNPLDPAYYCREWAEWARRLSVTLGHDSKEKGDDSSSSGPIVAGAKVILLHGRNVCDPKEFGEVQAALEQATARAATLFNAVGDRLCDMYEHGDLPAVKKEYPSLTREQCLLEATGEERFFTALQTDLGEQAPNVVLDALKGSGGVKPFVVLDRAARDVIERFQLAPQLSLSGLTKQRNHDGTDEYSANLIFEYGIVRRLNLTANASYERDDRKHAEDADGGRVAVQLTYQPMEDDLQGPKPLRVSVAFDAEWATHKDPIYKGQVKVNLPIPRIAALQGLELPLSLTIANRSELVDETEVRGLVGFTLDTSHILQGLQQRLETP